MTNSIIRFSTFPRTEPPPDFVENVVTTRWAQGEEHNASEAQPRWTFSIFMIVLATSIPFVVTGVTTGVKTVVFRDSMLLFARFPCKPKENRRADERTRTANLLITSARSGVAKRCAGLRIPYI
jgi:hypothetical protein